LFFLYVKIAGKDQASIGREHHAIGSQAEALSVLETEIPRYLGSGKLSSVLVADTALFEHYDEPAKCVAWLTAALRAWLRTNEQFNRDVGASIFYRYIVLACPSALANPYRRKSLIDFILLNLHLHLWHGVICGIVFLDPRKVDVGKVSLDLNFTAIPVAGTLYDMPTFYESSDIKVAKRTGSAARSRLEQATRWLFPGGRQPIWLYYDEANFSHTRLSGWRWEQLRDFFRSLYGPNPACPGIGIGCPRKLASFSLDHIAPISWGHFQTLINFRPLCKQCNSAKGDYQSEDPFNIRLLLPPDLRTRELEDLHRIAPPWLGKVDRPVSPRELLGRHMSFKRRDS
jgi:hypothetical protein